MNKTTDKHNIERRAEFVRERRERAKEQFARHIAIAKAVYTNTVRNGGDVVSAYSTLLQYQNEALIKGFCAG